MKNLLSHIRFFLAIVIMFIISTIIHIPYFIIQFVSKVEAIRYWHYINNTKPIKWMDKFLERLSGDKLLET